jgi:hypothetical protein
MNDRSWMYRVSPEGLCMMDYCNGVEGFINYAVSNLKTINGGSIRYPCKMCKNKKFFNLDIVMMYLLNKSSKRNTCVSLHTENYRFLTRP